MLLALLEYKILGVDLVLLVLYLQRMIGKYKTCNLNKPVEYHNNTATVDEYGKAFEVLVVKTIVHFELEFLGIFLFLLARLLPGRVQLRVVQYVQKHISAFLVAVFLVEARVDHQYLIRHQIDLFRTVRIRFEDKLGFSKGHVSQ
jgi:hypothetical protein